MTEHDPQKAFEAEVKAQAKRRNTIQNGTSADVVDLLRQAFADIDAKLKGQPSDYEQWQIPQLKRAIEAALLEFGETAGEKASAGQGDAWEAGQELVTAPLEKAGLHIKGLLPKIDQGQLLAMRHFMTSKMKDVGAQAVTRINTQLGFMIVGTQGVEDTIKGIQAIEPMARKRAITIIRTEVGRAYAVASQARSEQASKHVPGMQKQWRRSGKIHSRRSHDLADGQIRPVDKPFIMGTGAVIDGQEGNGARLMHPHDPKASAAETVNCGCISLPYMDKWKDAGVLKDPGKRAFTEQEIALSPHKADYAEMEKTPSMDQIFKNNEAGKKAKAIKAAPENDEPMSVGILSSHDLNPGTLGYTEPSNPLKPSNSILPSKISPKPEDKPKTKNRKKSAGNYAEMEKTPSMDQIFKNNEAGKKAKAIKAAPENDEPMSVGILSSHDLNPGTLGYTEPSNPLKPSNSILPSKISPKPEDKPKTKNRKKSAGKNSD